MCVSDLVWYLIVSIPDFAFFFTFMHTVRTGIELFYNYIGNNFVHLSLHSKLKFAVLFCSSSAKGCFVQCYAVLGDLHPKIIYAT